MLLVSSAGRETQARSQLEILGGWRPAIRSAFTAGLLFALVSMVRGAQTGLAGEAKPEPRGPGTIRMAERLEKLAQQANPVNNIFLNAERARLLQAEVAKATDAAQRQSLRYSLACELLYSGQNTAA